MSFAYVDFSPSHYCIAVLAERVQHRLCMPASTTSTLHPAKVKHAIREPIKISGKVPIRFAGAQARNTAIVVPVAMSYGKSRSERHVSVRSHKSWFQSGEAQPPMPIFADDGHLRSERFRATV